MTHDKQLIERLNEESLQLRQLAWGRMDGGQECSISASLADEAAQRLSTLTAEIEELRELLERWLRLADSGHFRDAAELSLSAHPVADDTRATLKGEGTDHDQ